MSSDLALKGGFGSFADVWPDGLPVSRSWLKVEEGSCKTAASISSEAGMN